MKKVNIIFFFKKGVLLPRFILLQDLRVMKHQLQKEILKFVWLTFSQVSSESNKI